MFRRPGTGPSKASATTLCQKCLKRGHYSYECKASAQERPYKSRPSRTQQLLNPQLQPKLTTQVPTDLLRKKGVADDMLKKKDEERGRTSRKRSRSRSTSSSADSVSTISTNRSPSRSPPPRRQKHDARRKRSQRSASTESRSSVDSRQRNTRRRRTSTSPAQRGRSPSRSHPIATLRSRSQSVEQIATASDRPRRAISPPVRRRRRSGSKHGSPSPRRTARRSPSPPRERSTRDVPTPAGRNRFDERPVESSGSGLQSVPAARQPPRERSLSPFSKRVALTRAMNAG